MCNIFRMLALLERFYFQIFQQFIDKIKKITYKVEENFDFYFSLINTKVSFYLVLLKKPIVMVIHLVIKIP